MTTETELRNACCNNQRWGVANRKHIGYIQQRPMAMPGVHDLPFSIDCSGWVVTVCRWSGVPTDPSGYNYTGYGNSDTIDAHCETIPITEVLWGDMVVFGPVGATTHVCMFVNSYRKVGENLTVISQGTPEGPDEISFWDEAAAHPGEYRFKRLVT